ncbi:MAG: exopolyphosphatase, partial [Primorskyibacter sp.]
ACLFAESKDARLPGAGKRLYQFVAPLFTQTMPARRRIAKAACLLHDVSWRAHPDYRAETCFDYATRANLGGLKHAERIFLGLALMHRYRNKREGTRFNKLAALLDGDAERDAEILGRAMRLGALLFMESQDPSTAQLSWDGPDLLLRIHRNVHHPLGEVAEERLNRLAGAIGCASRIEVITP